MKFDLVFEETYPHPLEKVWAALTSDAALSAWLNDVVGFEPVIGCRFQMRCTLDDGSVDVYHCEVLAIDPPRLMRWSWLLEQPGDPPPTEVEFRLDEVDAGTRVQIRHSGDRSEEVAARFREGWPSKLASLASALSASNAPEETR